jgi:hypothetical protein
MTRPPGPESTDPEKAEWCAAVEWDKTVDRDDAVPGMQRRQSVCKIRDAELAAKLAEEFDVSGAE